MAKDLITKALSAKRESKSIEFKASFDVDSPGDWCEIIKDIIAIANSGGGIILIGVDDKGRISKFNVDKILKLDHADMVAKIYKYTDVHFVDFEVIETKKRNRKIAAFVIGEARIPMIFTKPGTYEISSKKQKTAFGQGTIYFRHGARSEHGTSDDLRKSLERELSRIRKDWINGVRKVVTAPRDSKVVVVGKEVLESNSPNAIPIRIVDDPEAPPFRKIDPDQSHPYRQKELISELNKRLDGQFTINTYDILCLSRIYKIQDNSSYCYKPRFGSPQYSGGLIDWIINEYKKNKDFFSDARQACFERRYELGLVSPKKAKNK